MAHAHRNLGARYWRRVPQEAARIVLVRWIAHTVRAKRAVEPLGYWDEWFRGRHWGQLHGPVGCRPRPDSLQSKED